MNTSLSVVKRIQELLVSIRKNHTLDKNALLALDKDSKYIEKCIAILSDDDGETMNELWREVQYLSRFFGGDYAQGTDQTNLTILIDEFESALLDDIVATRAKS